MKEILDLNNIDDIILYRLSRAYESLNEADLMYGSGHFNAAVNRLYYACYYAATSLLAKNNVRIRSHNGVKSLLFTHFVSKGLLSSEVGNSFVNLQKNRHSGDYDDFVYCDKEMVDELTPKARDFIDAVRYLINQ